MTAGLPGLRTVPSPLAPRLQAGADLHVHTTHSDGLCSPCEVVIAAAGAGLAALAISDHDTVSALAIARPEAARLGLELVAGAELTCELNGREVHLLGHFLGDDDRSLLAALGWLRAGRGPRLQAMAEKLRDHGLVLDLDALRQSFPRAVLGCHHAAQPSKRVRYSEQSMRVTKIEKMERPENEGKHPQGPFRSVYGHLHSFGRS